VGEPVEIGFDVTVVISLLQVKKVIRPVKIDVFISCK